MRAFINWPRCRVLALRVITCDFVKRKNLTCAWCAISSYIHIARYFRTYITHITRISRVSVKYDCVFVCGCHRIRCTRSRSEVANLCWCAVLGVHVSLPPHIIHAAETSARRFGVIVRGRRAAERLGGEHNDPTKPRHSLSMSGVR